MLSTQGDAGASFNLAPARDSSGAQELNFNVMWESKDLAKLCSEVSPRIARLGRCGCQFCDPSDPFVAVHVFHDHMRRLHNPLPTFRPSKRQRQRQRELATQALKEKADEAMQGATCGQAEGADMEIDPGFGAGGYDDCGLPFGDDDGLAGLGESPGDSGSEMEVDEDGDGQGPQGTAAAIAVGRTSPQTARSGTPSPPHTSPFPPIDDITPPPSPQLSAAAGERDIVQQVGGPNWPLTLPHSLRYPFARGSAPSPFVGGEAVSLTTPTDLPKAVIPLLGLNLAALYHLPHRGAALASRWTSILTHWVFRLVCSHAEKTAREMWPDKEKEMGEFKRRLALAEPLCPTGPKKYQTMLARLAINDFLIVHPVCPDRECFEVFYDITNKKAFKSLPARCPSCDRDFQRPGSQPPLEYPRRTFQSELETILRQREAEESIEHAGRRREKRAAKHAAAGRGKVYEAQDDGSLYESGEGDDPTCLHLTANLSFDYANFNSMAHGHSHSAGPITGQIVELEGDLRIQEKYTMLLGICPGPSAPRAHSLWKVLLPIAIELLVGMTVGYWVRTAAYPDGRRVMVHFGCFICDRPAAVELTGYGHYTANDSPCMRCTVQAKDVGPFDISPPRDSKSHSAAMYTLMRKLVPALAEDVAAWSSEISDLPADHPDRLAGYPVKRRNNLYVRVHKDIERGWISAFNILGPEIDLIAHMPFETMHLLYEGVAKALWWRCLVNGEYGPIETHNKEVDAARKKAATAARKQAKKDEVAAARAAKKHGGAVNATGVGEVGGPASTSAPSTSTIAANSQIPRRLAGTDPKLLDADIVALRGLIDRVTLPHGTSRLRSWGGGSASPTAAEWRAWVSVFGPLVLPLLFAERRSISPRPDNHGLFTTTTLDLFMRSFELTILAAAYRIEEAQVEELDGLIQSWRPVAYELYPGLKDLPNLHCLAHVCDDIRRFGPTPGCWAFPPERINLVLKSANQGGGQGSKEVTALRFWQQRRAVDSSNHEFTSAGAAGLSTAEIDTGGVGTGIGEEAWVREEMGRLQNGLDDLLHPNPSASEATSSASADAGISSKSYDAASLRLRLHGRSQEAEMSPGVMRDVSSALTAAGMTFWSCMTSTQDGVAYLGYTATCYEQLTIGTRIFDAADYHGALRLVDRGDSSGLLLQHRSLLQLRLAADGPLSSGILCEIFETRRRMPSRQCHRDLFGIVRLFVPYRGALYYDYAARTHLGVELWRYGLLGAAQVIRLTDPILESMRPLASLAVSTRSGQERMVLITIPSPKRRSLLAWISSTVQANLAHSLSFSPAADYGDLTEDVETTPISDEQDSLQDARLH